MPPKKRKYKVQKSYCHQKWVVDTVTGKKYPRVRDAAESIGMKRSTLIAQLNGHATNRTNFIYEENMNQE